MDHDPYALLNHLSGGVYTGAAPQRRPSSPGEHRRGRDRVTTGATLAMKLPTKAALLPKNAPPAQVAIPKASMRITAPAPPPPPPPLAMLPMPVMTYAPPPEPARSAFAMPLPPAPAPIAMLPSPPRMTALAPALPPPLPPAAIAPPIPASMALAGPPVPVGPAPALQSAQASQARNIANRVAPPGFGANALLPVSQSAALFRGGASSPLPQAMPHPTALATAQRAASVSSRPLASRGGSQGPQPQPARGHTMGLRYEPTGKRTYCPFVSLAVAAGGSVDIIVRPQLVFRADEIIVGGTVAAAPFNLTQVKIGVVPQAVAGGEVPTECFPASCGPKFGFDIADQGTDITMSVKNYNAAAKDFFGILVGDEVYPVAA